MKNEQSPTYLDIYIVYYQIPSTMEQLILIDLGIFKPCDQLNIELFHAIFCDLFTYLLRILL